MNMSKSILGVFVAKLTPIQHGREITLTHSGLSTTKSLMSTERLKDRLRGIPFGFKFLVPQTKWQPNPWDTFDGVVKALIIHLRGNPHIQKQLGWTSLDYHYVADKVDEYNAAICKAQGWNHFIQDGGVALANVPKAWPRPQRVVQAAAVGLDTIKEMFGPEGPIQDKELAGNRAVVCSGCAWNDQEGSWEALFTVPASNLIRKVLGALKAQKLETDSDASLGTCKVCLCPLKLKVWARLNHILNHLPPEDKAQLPDFCWIKREESLLSPQK